MMKITRERLQASTHTTAILYSDCISEIKRIDKQKMAVML